MTLTKTAILVKRVIFFSAISGIVSIISFVGYSAAHNYYISRLPPPEVKPDTKFGKLPPPDFPDSLVPSSNFTYTLDTVTGNLPKFNQDPGFDKIIKVYFVNKPVATLLSPDRSAAFAAKFGITTPPQVLSELVYRYYQNDKTITIDIDTQNFKYAKVNVPLATELLPDENSLIAGFKGILSNAGAIKGEFEEGLGKVTYMKMENEKLVPTSVRSEARYAHISLWPKSLDNKVINFPKYNVSLVSALVSQSSDRLEDYLSIEFTYWAVDTTTVATYPAKSLDLAFDELKSGQGTVIIEPPTPQVSITSVSFGYYMSENYKPYLEPIYIFEGPQFVAYVGAVDNSLIIAAPTQNSNKPSQ